MTVSITAVILLGGLATGCGADDVADQMVENAVESAADEDVDVDLDTESGELTLESDDGSVEVGGGLPDEFADVPLPDGFEIVGGASVEQGGQQRYTGTGRLAGDPESVWQELISFYESQDAEVTVDEGLNRVTAIVDGGNLGIQLIVVENMSSDAGTATVQVHIGAPQ